MKVIIEFDCDNASFHPEDDSPNLALRLSVFTYAMSMVLDQAKNKIFKQYVRPEALCEHNEADDLLYDVNGNRIGTVKLVRELEPICAKCGKEHEGGDEFMMAIDAEDGREKLMCSGCVEAQGGHGFEYESEKE
jgi:hypothetical protein